MEGYLTALRTKDSTPSISLKMGEEEERALFLRLLQEKEQEQMLNRKEQEASQEMGQIKVLFILRRVNQIFILPIRS